MKKIFGTDGIRCIVNQEPMTAESCLQIAKITGYLLSNNKSIKQRVVISKDTRLSGYLFEPLLTAGFISMGMDVILVGPLPTSALPMLIKSLRADMGVMITASHNTFEYNGLKFFDSKGFKINKELEYKIESIVSDIKKYKKITNLSYESGKALRLDDAQGRYSEYLKSTLENKLHFQNIKVVLDCANGATYNIAPKLFWEIGCDVVTINNNPNGKNINHNCGAVNTKKLSKKVISEKADIGFAFDGDGDRLIVVDEKGKEIDGDKILALFAKNYVKSKKLNKNTLVSTVMSNLGLEKYLLKNLGIRLIRVDVGDFNVVSKMQKRKYNLGGEQSGHIILGNYMSTGDGILTAMQIVQIFANEKTKVSKLFNLYKSYPQIKINIKINKKISRNTENVIKKIGVNFSLKYKNFRILIRKSGTEPLYRVLVEGSSIKNCSIISKKIVNNIKKNIDAC
ncbi:phosphoglucosamine mutase [Alphaproteobacteria bacterium]|nr:phosphoglucosamine mutase [Alphaproteobacteria bacterium]